MVLPLSGMLEIVRYRLLAPFARHEGAFLGDCRDGGFEVHEYHIEDGACSADYASRGTELRPHCAPRTAACICRAVAAFFSYPWIQLKLAKTYDRRTSSMS